MNMQHANHHNLKKNQLLRETFYLLLICHWIFCQQIWKIYLTNTLVIVLQEEYAIPVRHSLMCSCRTSLSLNSTRLKMQQSPRMLYKAINFPRMTEDSLLILIGYLELFIIANYGRITAIESVNLKMVHLEPCRDVRLRHQQDTIIMINIVVSELNTLIWMFPDRPHTLWIAVTMTLLQYMYVRSLYFILATPLNIIPNVLFNFWIVLYC